MNDLLFHQSTSSSIEAFLNKPSHALIIEGKQGSGKRSVANLISSKLLDISAANLNSFPNLLIIEPDKSSISIDKIRQAQQFLKLKTTGEAPIRRVLTVDQAELMTIEAQNAFLKILEEPPADTAILILTSQKIKLLPTIRSRAQSLAIKSVTKEQIDNYFKDLGYDQTAINQAFHISNGRIGLISSILNDSDTDSQLDSINQAKKILSMTKFERLAAVDALAKNKDNLPEIIDALSIISQAALKQTLNQDKTKQAKQWHHTLKLATETEQKLPLNPNTKLLLTDLLLSL